MEAARSATVRDVARLAGVSTATVSRALNGREHVEPETVRKVKRAAAQLRYAPDLTGRSLRMRRTQTIGVAVADITNPFFASLIKEVSTEARSVGLGVILTDADNSPVTELENVSRLLARRVDAILITPCVREESRAVVDRASQTVPTVQVDRFASRRTHYVGIDYRDAIAQIFDHLELEGYRRPVFIGGDPAVSTTWRRQQAFTAQVTRFGAGFVRRVLTGSYSREHGYRAASKALDRWPDLDSIVCANDLIALGAADWLIHNGRRVPEDVAITGFDDTASVMTLNFKLTTVEQPLRLMAKKSIEIVMAGAQCEPPEYLELPASLKLGESSSPRMAASASQ